MKPDDFEKRLQSQPLRQIPTEWRKEILQSAMQPTPLARRSEAKAARPSWLSTILWPNPKAWAGLAAVWAFIFVLHFAGGEASPVVATIPTSRSPETVLTFREQQKILVELIGNSDPHDSEKPRRLPEQPHTERRAGTSMV